MTIHERERPRSTSGKANAPPTIGLRVNGKEYGGWKTARVTRGIKAVSGSFELSVSERWGTQETPWPIFEEDECKVAIGDIVLITGFVDRRSLSYSASDHTLTLAGRDAAGILVDCSALLNGQWEFKNADALKLAKKLCAPYSIPVSLQSGLTLPTAPKKLSIDPGDTAFNAIEQACRLAGVLPISDGAGGLVLTRAGTGRCSTELVEGENILAASADFDASGRFAAYVVLGQHFGDDGNNGVSASSIRGAATDENVRRSARTLVIRPEGNVTVEHAKKRAQWEAKTRAARAASVSVTVQGWLQGNGDLWPTNKLVRLRSNLLGIDGDMLISQASYSIGDDGTKTVLTLERPDAFTPEPTIKTKAEGVWKHLERGV